MTDRKLARIQKQKRRLWYGGYPTQFGVQYYQLLKENDRLHDEMMGNLRRQHLIMASYTG